MEFTKPGVGMTMNVAYVQRIKKEVGPALVASQGLKGIGYHVEHFEMEDIDKLPLTPATLVVAFIEPFRAAAEKIYTTNCKSKEATMRTFGLFGPSDPQVAFEVFQGENAEDARIKAQTAANEKNIRVVLSDGPGIHPVEHFDPE